MSILGEVSGPSAPNGFFVPPVSCSPYFPISALSRICRDFLSCPAYETYHPGGFPASVQTFLERFPTPKEGPDPLRYSMVHTVSGSWVFRLFGVPSMLSLTHASWVQFLLNVCLSVFMSPYMRSIPSSSFVSSGSSPFFSNRDSSAGSGFFFLYTLIPV